MSIPEEGVAQQLKKPVDVEQKRNSVGTDVTTSGGEGETSGDGADGEDDVDASSEDEEAARLRRASMFVAMEAE